MGAQQRVSSAVHIYIYIYIYIGAREVTLSANSYACGRKSRESKQEQDTTLIPVPLQ